MYYRVHQSQYYYANLHHARCPRIQPESNQNSKHFHVKSAQLIALARKNRPLHRGRRRRWLLCTRWWRRWWSLLDISIAVHGPRTASSIRRLAIRGHRRNRLLTTSVPPIRAGARLRIGIGMIHIRIRSNSADGTKRRDARVQVLTGGPIWRLTVGAEVTVLTHLRGAFKGRRPTDLWPLVTVRISIRIIRWRFRPDDGSGLDGIRIFFVERLEAFMERMCSIGAGTTRTAAVRWRRALTSQLALTPGALISSLLTRQATHFSAGEAPPCTARGTSIAHPKKTPCRRHPHPRFL